MNNNLFNPLSQASYFITSRFNQKVLSTATAFFVIRKSKYYLITNWHVVSGRNSETGECLSHTCAIPNNLLIRLHKKQKIIDFEDFQLSLLDNTGSKLWLEHPLFGSEVDVVALEVQIPSHLTIFDIENFIEPFNEDTNEAIPNDVFVIGYPFGLSVESIFPIWKRASISSEPCVDIGGLPKMLVDTASREGMSGSPVILYERRSISIVDRNPNENGVKVSNFRMKLVGIYSGRIGVDDKNIQAQLGIVWKSHVIDKIIFKT